MNGVFLPIKEVKKHQTFKDIGTVLVDFDETLAEACSREIYEETGVKIEPSALYMCSVNDDPKDSNRQNVTMRFMAVVDESHIGISTNAIKGQLGGEENEVKAIMWVKISDLDNYQWAFNHKHLIEGIFYTYVDYEEVEGLDNLFTE